MSAAPTPRPGAVAAAWVAVAALMALLAGDYRLSVAVAAGVLAVAAVGVDLTVGSAGMLVFSAPAFMLLGALASAVVGLRSGLPPTAATVVGVMAGLAVGLVLAGVVGLALRRVSGVGIALLTLFVLHLVRSVVRQQEALGGSLGLTGVPPFELGGFRADTPMSQAVLVLASLALVLAGVTRLLRSGPGLELRAVRADQRAAAACGVAASRRRFEAFVVGSLCATLAGSLYAHTLGYVSADSASLAVLMDLLLMVFLGGAGSVWGAAIGAVLVRMVPELYGGPDRFDVLARGAAFLFVLTLAPGGLAAAAGAVTGRIGAGRIGPGRNSRWRSVFGRAGARPPTGPSTGAHSPIIPGPGRPEGRLLEAVGVSRSFGGVRALDDVNLTIAAGELCGVIGPNGAGKTTLFNVLTGTVGAERGRIRFDGVDITDLPPERRARLGIVRTFQEVRLFPGLTVLEHAVVGSGEANDVGVAEALAGRPLGLRRGGAGGRAALTTARQALDLTGLAGMADMPADGLPFGWQRRVELARALAGRPRLLLLDEPAAGLSEAEREDLVEVIRAVAANHCAVVVVDHNLDFVVGLARRIVVLDRGRVVFDGPADRALENPAVAGAYRPGSVTGP